MRSCSPGRARSTPAWAAQLYEPAGVPARRSTGARTSLRAVLDRPLLDVLCRAGRRAPPLDQTQYTQPALFALEYALAELWQVVGRRAGGRAGPQRRRVRRGVRGRRAGLEDALRLVAARGRLMQALPAGGAMAAVFAAEAAVAARSPRLAASWRSPR